MPVQMACSTYQPPRGPLEMNWGQRRGEGRVERGGEEGRKRKKGGKGRNNEGKNEEVCD